MSGEPLDLSTCDREPIHIPGAIQPHGALVALDSRGATITHVSDNVRALWGVEPAKLLGQKFEALERWGAPATRTPLDWKELEDGRPIYGLTWAFGDPGKPWDVIVHRHAGRLFLEFEPADGRPAERASGLYHNLHAALGRVERAESILEMADDACRKVRRLCDFDRVMFYRFDKQWNGEVIAEARRDALEPFLGLHYPASDIPQQARALYAKNWLRFIADRDYVPATVLAADGADGPLDMSYAVLRSVSPIHLQYLRNMGVFASMSISILKQGSLWGLIACHHYSPKFVPYDLRKACELLGHFMSLQVAEIEANETRSVRESQADIAARLLANLDRDEDFANALLSSTPTLLDLIPAGGAAVVTDGRVSRMGQTPSEAEIKLLGERVLARDVEVFATDAIQGELGSSVLGPVSAGVLAINLGYDRPHQLMWFRPEQVRTVDWAGDPRKAALDEEGVDRLSPRGSFALWRETVKGQSAPWTEDQVAAARDLRRQVVRLLVKRSETLAAANADMRLANVEREKSLESERAARAELERLNRVKDEFVATLSHELRTPLNAILGWSQLLQTVGGRSADELSEGLAIIERNARAQASMLEDLLEVSRIIGGRLRLDLQDVNLATLVEEAIQSQLVAAQAKEIRIEKLVDSLFGIKATGDPNRLRQVAWNLLSNAIKFTPKGGKVQVVLEKVDSHVEFSVSDTGIGIAKDVLPHVFDRYRQADASIGREYGGLGLGLAIVRSLVELHGGVVSAESAGPGRGSMFTVSLPIRVVAGQVDGDAKWAAPTSDGESAISLAGLEILIVDDEGDARLMVGKVLGKAGAAVTLAASASDALQLFEPGRFDAVISDIGMANVDGYEFIRAWRVKEAAAKAKKAPAVALTAYAQAKDRRRALMAGFTAHLPKPVEAMELVTTVASITDRIVAE